jgi:hypothetical protein
MKNLLKRFKLYAVGFLIGLLFVVFFFQNRGCSWLPSNRVMNTLLDKVLVLPDSELEKIMNNNLNHSDLISFLKDGDINFRVSLKDQSIFPKAYVFEKEINNQLQRIQFSIYEDSYISVIHFLGQEDEPQRFQELTGYGSFIRIPRDTALVFLDKSSYTQCKASGLKINDKDKVAQLLKNSGRIDFSKSNLMLPKAEHHIRYQEDDSTTVSAKTIWFESRITFKDFYWEETLPCE